MHAETYDFAAELEWLRAKQLAEPRPQDPADSLLSPELGENVMKLEKQYTARRDKMYYNRMMFLEGLCRKNEFFMG